MKSIYFKIAGIVNLFGALLHTIAGQIELVNPLLDSNINIQQKAELTGAWHIVTILLFFTSYTILKTAFRNDTANRKEIKSIAILYLLSGIPFMLSSFWFGVHAFQWILLIPIGILLFIGLAKSGKKGQK